MGKRGRGGDTYGEGEEAEAEEDAGVADEGENVHLVNCLGRRRGPWMRWMMGVDRAGELQAEVTAGAPLGKVSALGKIAHEKCF